MKVFQLAIVGAVLFSNIRWNWTLNGYLAALIGVFVAYLATLLATHLQSRLGKKRLQ